MTVRLAVVLAAHGPMLRFGVLFQIPHRLRTVAKADGVGNTVPAHGIAG